MSKKTVYLLNDSSDVTDYIDTNGTFESKRTNLREFAL